MMIKIKIIPMLYYYYKKYNIGENSKLLIIPAKTNIPSNLKLSISAV